jgi:hypothetical protein
MKTDHPIMLLLVFGLVLLGLVGTCICTPEGVYIPDDEKMRGKDMDMSKTFTRRLGKIRAKGGSLKLVIGYSTGHVGTTSLSKKSSYDKEDLMAKHIHFIFEMAGVRPAVCSSSSWTLQSEIEHVEYYYGPTILDYKDDADLSAEVTIVDLSHANLCFYRGLVWVLRYNQVPFQFVRIRRERIETVISMSTQKDEFVNFFDKDYYHYEPFAENDEVHLPVPGGEKTWSKMTHAQHVMWVIDETQARWESFLHHFPDISHYEVYWSKLNDDFNNAFAKVAKAIGVKPGLDGPVEVKIHAGDSAESDTKRKRLLKQDDEYRQMMGFNDTTSTELTGFHIMLHRKIDRKNVGPLYASLNSTSQF